MAFVTISLAVALGSASMPGPRGTLMTRNGSSAGDHAPRNAPTISASGAVETHSRSSLPWCRRPSDDTGSSSTNGSRAQPKLQASPPVAFSRSRRSETRRRCLGSLCPPTQVRDSQAGGVSGRRAAFRGNGAAGDGPRAGLLLVARGIIQPTVSHVALDGEPARLGLSCSRSAGGASVTCEGSRLSLGKDKTILVDLTGLFGATGPRRLRLPTNLEIFWDTLGWAIGRPEVEVHPRKLELQGADLSYRGYSVTEQPASSVPERPRYTLAGTAPLWRDLEGYYTASATCGSVRTVDADTSS